MKTAVDALRFILEFTQMELSSRAADIRARAGWNAVFRFITNRAPGGMIILPLRLYTLGPNFDRAFEEDVEGGRVPTTIDELRSLQGDLKWFFSVVADRNAEGFPIFELSGLRLAVQPVRFWAQFAAYPWTKGLKPPLKVPFHLLVAGPFEEVARYIIVRLLEQVGIGKLLVCQS